MQMNIQPPRRNVLKLPLNPEGSDWFCFSTLSPEALSTSDFFKAASFDNMWVHYEKGRLSLGLLASGHLNLFRFAPGFIQVKETQLFLQRVLYSTIEDCLPMSPDEFAVSRRFRFKPWVAEPELLATLPVVPSPVLANVFIHLTDAEATMMIVPPNDLDNLYCLTYPIEVAIPSKRTLEQVCPN